MDNNVADMLMRSAHFIVEQSMNLTLDRQVDGQVEVNHFLTIRPLDPNDPVWTDNLGNRIGSLAMMSDEAAGLFRAYAELLEATADETES
jgi:hypothetical protein